MLTIAAMHVHRQSIVSLAILQMARLRRWGPLVHFLGDEVYVLAVQHYYIWCIETCLTKEIKQEAGLATFVLYVIVTLGSMPVG